MDSNKVDSKIASIVRNRYTRLRDSQSEIFDDVEMYHQMYRVSVDQNDSWEWDYNLVDPVVFYLMRNMLARLNPENMAVRLEARNSRDQATREVNQQIVNWELTEMGKTLIFYRMIFRGLLAGRGYLKTGWLFNKALEIKNGENSKKVMRDIVNRAFASNLRFQDLFIPNRNIPELGDQPYLIERINMRYGEMLDDNKSQDKEVWNQSYLRQIKEKKMFVTQVDYGVDLPLLDDGIEKDQENKFLKSQYVSLLRMQTLDGDVLYVPEKENDWILNTERGNQYWHGHYPYLSFTPFPEDDEFFSMGIVQPVADLQIALTSTLNQYLTNARKSGNPMWIAGAAAAQTPDWMFVNRPDGIVRVAGDANQISQVRSVDTSETMIAMRREVMSSFERTSSMSSYFSTGAAGGSSPQLNKTATGAKIIDSNIESSLQMLITLFGAMTLSKLGEHFLELNAQYITEEQEIKITDRNGIAYVKAQPSEITANFDCVANADTMTKTNPTVKQAQLLNLKATMDAEKDVKFDKKPIWKSILNSFPEMDGVDDVIIDPENQTQEAIEAIMSGVEPEITPNMDHKTIIKLVQVFMLTNSEAMDDKQLKLMTKYIDDQRKYIEAEKMLFTLENPLAPTDPNMMGNKMNVIPANLPQNGNGGGQMLPNDEASLMKSLNSQGQAATNPTNSLPNKLPEQTMI